MIDLDRVVFNCKAFPYNLVNSIFTASSINKPLRYHVVDTELAKQYKNKLSFLRLFNKHYLVALEDSIKTLKMWNQQGFSLNFVSSRPNLKSLKKLTTEWLEEQNIEYDSLIFSCTNKPIYCFKNKFDIIIDDTLTNCIYSTMYNMQSIWVTKNEKQSRSIDYDLPIYRATNWKEINKIVQSLNNKKLFYNQDILSL